MMASAQLKSEEIYREANFSGKLVGLCQTENIKDDTTPIKPATWNLYNDGKGNVSFWISDKTGEIIVRTTFENTLILKVTNEDGLVHFKVIDKTNNFLLLLELKDYGYIAQTCKTKIE